MELLNPYRSSYISAKSASEDLDIATILNGCNQVQERLNDLDYGVRNINSSKSFFDEKNFSIDDKGIVTQDISDCATSLENIKQYIFDVVEEVRMNAVARYNEIQEYYNSDAIRQENEIRNNS